jgi:hypothetical protein
MPCIGDDPVAGPIATRWGAANLTRRIADDHVTLLEQLLSEARASAVLAAAVEARAAQDMARAEADWRRRMSEEERNG